MYKLEYRNNCVHEKIPHGSKTKLKLSLNSHVYCDTLYICLALFTQKNYRRYQKKYLKSATTMSASPVKTSPKHTVNKIQWSAFISIQ